ncbi:MAG: RNA polymerase sigma factor [Propionibacteriaceae bacterium]|nr:RNA polymerase sigma factor [Propionibacteriaceae bacterium]
MRVMTAPSEFDVAAVYRRRVGSVYRLCFAYLRCRADAEDAVQETFVRLIRSAPIFQSAAHEEGWLIRTAINICKDALKRALRRHETAAVDPVQTEPEVDATLGAVLALPDKHKAVVYLYYYEGYATGEIAALLEERPSTVRNRLADARALLRRNLGGGFDAK